MYKTKETNTKFIKKKKNNSRQRTIFMLPFHRIAAGDMVRVTDHS